MVMAAAAGGVAAAHAYTADQRTNQIKDLTEKSRDRLSKELERELTREQWPTTRKFLYHLVSSHWFEVGCGLIILFNMGLVVLETDAGVNEGDPPAWMKAMTNCLLVIYTTELTVKLYVYRLEFFKEMWNVLDFLIVGVDLIFLIVAIIVDQMPSISILRVFRLVRLARAFKAAKSFRELNSLLRACTCALKAIFWGMVMMVMTLTVWGILAVQLIHPINKVIYERNPAIYEGCERCSRSYSTVFDSALTFWKQLVAGDSWGTLCEPIIEEAPWTAFFFMLVLVTMNLTMLNCILAVVVEAGASAAAADLHDKAMQHEKLVAQAEGKLIDLCGSLDADESGQLSIQEFMKGFKENLDFKECLELMNVTEADMCMIFNICDEDDSGEVDYREFVDQFRRIKHSGEQMLLHYVTDIRHRVNLIRPECLKQHPFADRQPENEMKLQEAKEGAQPDGAMGAKEGPQAKASSSGEDVGQLESTALAKDLPPVLADLLASGSGDDGAAAQDSSRPTGDEGKFQEKKGDVVDVTEVLSKEKVERIFDLVNIMTDLADQSKVQTELLTVLVQKANKQSDGRAEDRPSGAAGQDASDPDVVQLGPGMTAQSNTANSQTRSGTMCCARVV